MSQPISTLDPFHDDTAVYVTSLSVETLFKIAPNGHVVPNLAQSVSHPNSVTYVYHLRKGIKFWDGRELTAADVANALNYNRKAGSQLAFFYVSVKSIKASGRYTVVVTLLHPDASWQFSLAGYGTQIFEKKFAAAHPDTLGHPGVLTMGTGPWRITSFDPTSGVELAANPHYWGGKVPIQHISVKFFSDETSLALAMRAGEIDIDPSVTGPRAFKSASGAKLVSVPSCQEGLLSLDTMAAPWNDVHVRRAVAYATNRAGLITAYGGYASPNYTFIPPVQLRSIASKARVNALLKSLPSYPYSLSKARQELAKSAYPQGFSAADYVPNIPGFADTNQAIAGQLQKIGIKLQLQTMTEEQWLAILGGPRDKTGFSLFTSGCLTPDPSFYPGVYLGSANLQPGAFNAAAYAPPAVDKLIAAGVATSKQAKRLAIYGQLLKRLALDIPYLPLWVQDANLAISSKFTWPRFNANWYNGEGAWAMDIKPK